MVTRESTAKAAADKETPTGQSQSRQLPASLFNYYSDLAAANAEIIEQGMRLMGAPAQGNEQGGNGFMDAWSLGLKLMEQYQELAFAQMEAMGEVQSQLWQGLWAGGKPANTRRRRTPAKQP